MIKKTTDMKLYPFTRFDRKLMMPVLHISNHKTYTIAIYTLHIRQFTV